MPPLKTETGHQEAMDYHGKCLATASDKTIKIIGVSGNFHRYLATLNGHQGPVGSLHGHTPNLGGFLPPAAMMAVRSYGRKGTTLMSDHRPMYSLSTSPARWWDITRIDQAHPVGVSSVSWAPSTVPGSLVGSRPLDPVQKLVSGGCDNTVKVWKPYNGIWKMGYFPALQMHTAWVRDDAWAANLGLPKSTIASASQDGKVLIWTVAREAD